MAEIFGIAIASKFVRLVLKADWDNQWAGKEDFLPEDVEILFKTVSAAGFEPKSVVPGKLRGDYYNEERRATGETYPINSICPYKVLGETGADYRATGWLDSLVRFAIQSRARQNDDIIKMVRTEIARSVPLEPIQLTPDDDKLIEYPPSRTSDYFFDHTRDDHKLTSCVGLHAYCNGWIDRLRATETLDALSCRACRIRVLFPKTIATFGELRNFLSNKLSLAP